MSGHRSNLETGRAGSLERAARRLDTGIVRLKRLHIRLSWARLLVVVLTLTASAAATRHPSPYVAWSIFAAGMLGFTALALWHRRLERRMNRLSCHTGQLKAHRARIAVQWEGLRDAHTAPAAADHPFATDLSLLGTHSLHRLVDSCLTQRGSRQLADWMLETSHDWQAVSRRQQAVRGLSNQASQWRLITTRLTAGRGQTLSSVALENWCQHSENTRSLKTRLTGAAGLLILNAILLVASRLWGLPPYWIITETLWLVFYLFTAKEFMAHFNLLSDVDAELNRLKPLLTALEQFPSAQNQALTELFAPLTRSAQRPARIIRRIRLTTAAIGLRHNPVMTLLLNMLLPWDLFFAWRAQIMEGEVKSHFPNWLQTMGEIDATAALAQFSWLHPRWTYPDINARFSTPSCEAVNMGHPLIAPALRRHNDLKISNHGHLHIITGSNMAGKSTFLRTIGINWVLAGMGCTVCASSFSVTALRLFTAMRADDSLADGFSTFYAEVRRLKQLLDLCLDEAEPVLFLVDEIFRGTNNRERLIGSRSLLRKLTETASLGLISTHDLELTSLARELPQISNYHFKESVNDGRLVFDYQIHSGPCPSTNALIIMKENGLPVEEGEMQ